MERKGAAGVSLRGQGSWRGRGRGREGKATPGRAGRARQHQEGEGRARQHQVTPQCWQQSPVLAINMDHGFTGAAVVSTQGEFRRYEGDILKCESYILTCFEKTRIDVPIL